MSAHVEYQEDESAPQAANDHAATVMLNRALSLVDRELSVIPLGQSGRELKIPRIKWQQYQSTAATQEEVEAWWQKWPLSNIGVCTGDTIVVVDADTSEAVEWCDANLPLTPWQVVTGKGKHYYYAPVKGSTVKNSAGAGLDVRGQGGYVVAAGSHHETGHRYKWVELTGMSADYGNELPELTDALLTLIAGFRSNATNSPADSLSGDVLLDLSCVKNEAGEPASKGSRNTECARVAGKLFHQGYSVNEVLEQCFTWNETNDPPLTENEVERTVRSISGKHKSGVAKRKIEAQTSRVIKVLPGNIAEVCDLSEMILEQAGSHYNAGGQIVSVLLDHTTTMARVAPVSAHGLTDSLSRTAVFQKTLKTGEVQKMDPPVRHVAVLADRAEFKYLKPLIGVANQPFFRDDGSLCNTIGYDSQSKIYAYYDDSKYSIEQAPTKQDAFNALERIKGLFSGFEFADPSNDMAATICAALTATTRISLSAAPLVHVGAHVPGSGKSYLCELLKQLASPTAIGSGSFPSSDEECKKTLLAELMKAPAAIEFDNLVGSIPAYNSLCTVLTSERISGRILGESKIIEASTRTLFLSSGNNVEPLDDMVRRVLPISLHPAEESPEQRVFSNSPTELLSANREQYISDCLTIVRAWVVAGRPKADVPSINGFNQWSDFCRQPLIWLDMKDPAISMLLALRDNPGRSNVLAVIDELYTLFKSRPFAVRDILDTHGTGGLTELLLDVASKDGETINRNTLGWWLRRNVGRSIDGKVLLSEGSTRPAKWSVSITANAGQDYSKRRMGE